MIKQKLQHKLLQKLSPQQIQLIKLLEVPTIQLEQRIKKEIEENPILEEGADEDEQDLKMQEQEDDIEDKKDKDDEEFTLEDYISDEEDTPDYKLFANNFSKDDKHTEIPFSVGKTFQEHLNQQLGLRDFNEKQVKIAQYVIGNIDQDGYLRREVEAIADDLAFSQNLTVEDQEVEDILKTVQEFDPAGVGSRDLQECLLLQVKAKIRAGEDSLAIELADKILKNFFNEFTKKHYTKIINRLNISEEEFKEALDKILHLNPKPGASYGENQNRNFQQIIPDFLLDINDGDIQLQLNSKNAPELRISRTYANMLEAYNSTAKPTKKDKETVSFIKQKLDSARWFIDAIKQRQNTLLLTMNAIVEYQKEYFYEGEETKLRPMILKDIAERTDLDISTISRVANSKYIQTHFGIFALKYFFSEGMQTDSGEEVSTREIKSILQECIDAESKRKPLTDDKLSKILQDKGYQIARRTVAKYREQLNIPVARLRKEL